MDQENYGDWLWFFVKGLIISMIVWGIGYWKSSQVPKAAASLAPFQQEPWQSPSTKRPFEIKANGHSYQIQPVHDYEIWGLVVSDHSSKTWKDNVHESWNDHINTKDVCVVWGSNAISPYLSKWDFSHGSFTCYVKSTDEMAWRNFNLNKISNNHLIPATADIQKQIAESKVGDEIRIKGHLVNYSVDNGKFRNTSVTRTDKENGACEIIYVTEFETYVRNNKTWISIAKGGRILSILFLIAAAFSMLMISFFVKGPTD